MAGLAHTYLKSSELSLRPETHLHATGICDDKEYSGGTEMLDSGDCGSKVS